MIPDTMREPKLPNLFHIGTQRAGSSYLYNLLKSHPEVSLSPRQEIHFYAQHFARGVEWYLRTFETDGRRIDTSPKYFMLGQQVALRIKEAVTHPPPRFTLILRNPIDYVHSHYQMHLRNGYFAKHRDVYPTVPTNLVEFTKLYPQYLERGLYCKVLDDYWLPHFDASQFKIIIFEEFIAKTDEVISEVLEFFGLSLCQLATVPSTKNSMLRHPLLYKVQHTVAKRPWLSTALKNNKLFNHLYGTYLTGGRAQLDSVDRHWLRDYFSLDVDTLKKRIGTAIPAWPDFIG